MLSSDHLRWLRLVWSAPGNRGRRAAALFRALRWFMHRRLRPRDPLVVEIFGHFKFVCHAGSYMAKHVLYFSEFADYDIMHFIGAFLRPGDAFLDVGANAGLYALLAASRVGNGPVICVEPHPENLRILREHVAINGLLNVRILPIAAGSEDGELVLTGEDVFAGPAYSAAPHGAEFRVPVRTLDSVLPPERFALAKIDVEGYEWPALRGLGNAIHEARLPVLLLELNGCLRRYGFTEDGFCDWLKSQGYTLATYRHDQRTLEFSRQPRGDILALTEQGLAMVRERMAIVITRSSSNDSGAPPSLHDTSQPCGERP